jgi:hypothetical protein
MLILGVLILLDVAEWLPQSVIVDFLLQSHRCVSHLSVRFSM